jgi:hypothetical protein
MSVASLLGVEEPVPPDKPDSRLWRSYTLARVQRVLENEPDLLPSDARRRIYRSVAAEARARHPDIEVRDLIGAAPSDRPPKETSAAAPEAA